MGYLENIFLNVLEVSINASIVIVFIMIITKVFSEKINMRIKYTLWILAIVRLLLPIIPEININSVSIINQINKSNVHIQENNTITSTPSPQEYVNEVNNNSLSIISNTDTYVQESNNNSTENATSNNDKKIIDFTLIKKSSAFIWSIGFFALASTFIFGLLNFKKRTVILNNKEYKNIYNLIDNLVVNLEIKKKINIYISEDIKSPCIVGIVNPTIFIPEYILEISDQYKLKHIFLHELMHYKRKDLYYNLFSIIAISVHWFNPLAWIAINKMRNYREYVCDASVLEFIGEEENIEYGITLIDCSRRGLNTKAINSFQLAICFEEKNQIKGRINMIKEFKNGSIKMTKKGALSCLVAAAVVLSSGFVVFSKAEPVSASDKIEEVTEEKEIEFIVDSKTKTYKDINLSAKSTRIDFKLPNYMSDGVGYNYTSIGKFEDNEVVTVMYSNGLQLQMFKENPEEILKSIARWNHGHMGDTEVYSNPLKLGNIEGTEIIVKNLVLESDEVKSFVWKENEIYYAITYYINSCNSIFIDMNIDEVQKIAESLVDLSQIDAEKYVSKLGQDDYEKIKIYTQEDLNAAKELLGFEPSILRNVDENIKLESSTVYQFGERTSISSEYNNGNLSLDESKLNDEYKNTSLKDIIEAQVNGMKEEQAMEVTAEKLEDTEREVYRISYRHKNDPDAKTYLSYRWIENDISYSLSVRQINEVDNKSTTEDYDNIAIKFVNAK